MRELSIFIDESGDFGDLKERPAYYLITMVFLDQAIDIEEDIKKTFFRNLLKIVTWHDRLKLPKGVISSYHWWTSILRSGMAVLWHR